jgi:peroxin-19
MSTVRDGNDIGELMDDGNTKIPDGFGQDEEKILEGIFQSLGAMAGGGLGGVGGGSSGDGGAIDPDEFIDGMMEQILSKDLMYAPMKAVTEKFPEWLDRHKDDLTSEEYDQRRRQYMCFQKLVDVYESQDDVETTENKSSNKDINNRLIELMQEIQEYGQPPAEIVNEVAPGLELDENGMPKVDGVSPFGPTGTGDDCTVM